MDRSSVIKKIDCFLNTSINKKSQNLITQILTSFSMTGMSQVRGENPQEAPSAGELHSDLQVSDREVWERRSNSESVA